MPAKDRWVLRRAGVAGGRTFATQREAIEAGRKHFASAAGQIVIHNADGKIRAAVYFKVPKIQSPPGRVPSNADKIERAVTSIALAPQAN